MGLLVAAFAAAEWLVARDRRMERAGWLVRAALLGLLISVVMGIGLQGRAVAAGRRAQPGHRVRRGPDLDVLPAQHRRLHDPRTARRPRCRWPAA